MSYLGTPRIHFTGEFLAEPSTINNDPANFGGPTQDQGWNPNGTHRFAFANGRVTALVSDGQLITSGDPLVGAPVTTPGSPVAKIVDLDVEVQLASKIYGLNVAVTDSAGNSVRGLMASASFRDFSGPRLLGVFQSTLGSLQWHVTPTSWLAKLKATSPDMLSIRFITDLFTGFSGPHRGRLAGAIGPATADEPAHVVAGRRIVGVQGGPSALAELAGNVLTVDVGNVVPLQNNQSAYPTLTVAVKTAPAQHARSLKSGAVKSAIQAAAASALPVGWRTLGTVPTTVERYGLTSGIEPLQLSAHDAALVTSSPLALFTPAAAALAVESTDGTFVFPDRTAFAMNPGEQTAVNLTAVRFGRPAPALAIALQATKSGGSAGLTFPASVTTDGNGHARVDLAASDPGSPRAPLDGQVFGLGGDWATAGDILIPDAASAVAVHVFGDFSPPAAPRWDDVKPILEPYARLYPGMTQILDLSDVDAVTAGKDMIRSRLLLPLDDPGFMPVTRDLSERRRTMIVAWIDAGCPR